MQANNGGAPVRQPDVADVIPLLLGLDRNPAARGRQARRGRGRQFPAEMQGRNNQNRRGRHARPAGRRLGRPQNNNNQGDVRTPVIRTRYFISERVQQYLNNAYPIAEWSSVGHIDHTHPRLSLLRRRAEAHILFGCFGNRSFMFPALRPGQRICYIYGDPRRMSRDDRGRLVWCCLPQTDAELQTSLEQGIAEYQPQPGRPLEWCRCKPTPQVGGNPRCEHSVFSALLVNLVTAQSLDTMADFIDANCPVYTMSYGDRELENDARYSFFDGELMLTIDHRGTASAYCDELFQMPDYNQAHRSFTRGPFSYSPIVKMALGDWTVYQWTRTGLLNPPPPPEKERPTKMKIEFDVPSFWRLLGFPIPWGVRQATLWVDPVLYHDACASVTCRTRDLASYRNVVWSFKKMLTKNDGVYAEDLAMSVFEKGILKESSFLNRIRFGMVYAVHRDPLITIKVAAGVVATIIIAPLIWKVGSHYGRVLTNQVKPLVGKAKSFAAKARGLMHDRDPQPATFLSSLLGGFSPPSATLLRFGVSGIILVGAVVLRRIFHRLNDGLLVEPIRRPFGMALCAKPAPLPTIREDATLEFPVEDLKECGDREGVFVYGPVLVGSLIPTRAWCWRGCQHSEAYGLMGRVLMPTLEPVLRHDSFDHPLPAFARQNELLARLQRGSPWVRNGRVLALTNEEYIKRFGGSRRQALEDPKHQSRQKLPPSNIVKAFVKKEIYVDRDPSAAETWFHSWLLLAGDSKEPRIIQMSDEADQLMVGPWWHSYCKHFYSYLDWRTRRELLVTAPIGWHAEEFGEWYQEALGRREVCVLVGGDDSAALITSPDGMRYAIEADGSRMDAHQGVKAVVANADYIFEEVTDKHQESWYRKETRTRGVSGHGLVYRVPGGNKSGRPYTTQFNTKTCMGIWLQFIEDNLDRLEPDEAAEALREIGRSVYIKLSVVIRPVSDVEFYSSIFYPVGDGYVLGPKIGKQLPKLFASVNQYRTSQGVAWARGVAVCVSRDWNHVPILGVLIARVLELTRGVEGLRIHWSEYKIRASKKHFADSRTYDFVAARYGVSETEIKTVESWIAGLPLVCQFSHPLLDRFIEVDTATLGGTPPPTPVGPTCPLFRHHKIDFNNLFGPYESPFSWWTDKIKGENSTEAERLSLLYAPVYEEALVAMCPRPALGRALLVGLELFEAYYQGNFQGQLFTSVVCHGGCQLLQSLFGMSSYRLVRLVGVVAGMVFHAYYNSHVIRAREVVRFGHCRAQPFLTPQNLG